MIDSTKSITKQANFLKKQETNQEQNTVPDFLFKKTGIFNKN